MPTPENLRVFDDPSRFDTVEVPTNGIRLRVRVAGPATSKKLALCLHGFPENSYSWRYQMQCLADLGYRVWAPDLRGYGASDKPRRIADYRIQELVLDVAGLIDHFRESAARGPQSGGGPEEVVLLGHDWGGMVAWHFALRRLRKIDRLVVMNIPHPRRMAQALARLGPQLRRSWYIFLFQLPLVPERYLARDDYHAIGAAFASMAVDKSRFPESVLRVYREAAARPRAIEGMLAYYRAALRYPSTVRYPRLQTPTLLVWGEDDTALGKELTDRTDELVEDLTVRFIPRCSHWVQQEAPEVVNALLTDWLGGKEVREASAIPRG
ncbi:MAG: alpha/beta hydrolase [Sandaracinaceae bacterium]|nr:alpha/beta hydrolase [Sandaracinaceae bacterium]